MDIITIGLIGLAIVFAGALIWGVSRDAKLEEENVKPVSKKGIAPAFGTTSAALGTSRRKVRRVVNTRTKGGYDYYDEDDSILDPIMAIILWEALSDNDSDYEDTYTVQESEIGNGPGAYVGGGATVPAEDYSSELSTSEAFTPSSGSEPSSSYSSSGSSSGSSDSGSSCSSSSDSGSSCSSSSDSGSSCGGGD